MKNPKLKKLLIKMPTVFSMSMLALTLTACGKGDTSVETLEVTGGAVPAAFVGTYTGTLSVTARRGILEVDATDPITIIVSSNNTIEFRGDDPGESFTATIGSNGNFNGVLPIDTGDCSGDIDVSGSVNGAVALGDVGGEGSCSGFGSVGVSGSFSANK